MKRVTIISLVTIVLAAISSFIYMFIAINESHDTFQANINKLIQRKTVQDIRDANYNLSKLGPAIVPRLISELNILTNKLTEHQIYTLSNYGYLSDDTPDHLLGRMGLVRIEIYSLISEFDAHAYIEIITNLCNSNNPELCLALRGGDLEKLLDSQTNELLILTNTLAAKRISLQSDVAEKLCISNFFDRYALLRSATNYLKPIPTLKIHY